MYTHILSGERQLYLGFDLKLLGIQKACSSARSIAVTWLPPCPRTISTDPRTVSAPHTVVVDSCDRCHRPLIPLSVSPQIVSTVLSEHCRCRLRPFMWCVYSVIIVKPAQDLVGHPSRHGVDTAPGPRLPPWRGAVCPHAQDDETSAKACVGLRAHGGEAHEGGGHAGRCEANPRPPEHCDIDVACRTTRRRGRQSSTR